MITEIKYKVNVNTLHREEDDRSICMNDIVRAKIRATKPLYSDNYTVNRKQVPSF